MYYIGTHASLSSTERRVQLETLAAFAIEMMGFLGERLEDSEAATQKLIEFLWARSPYLLAENWNGSVTKKHRLDDLRRALLHEVDQMLKAARAADDGDRVRRLEQLESDCRQLPDDLFAAGPITVFNTDEEPTLAERERVRAVLSEVRKCDPPPIPDSFRVDQTGSKIPWPDLPNGPKAVLATPSTDLATAGSASDTSNFPKKGEPLSNDWLYAAASKICPEPHRRFDLPLQILKECLKRELITPEIGWKELGSIPSDDRYSDELRTCVSGELRHLSRPPVGGNEPALDALRDMVRQPPEKLSREVVRIVIKRILDAAEIGDARSTKRQGPASLGTEGTPDPQSIEIQFCSVPTRRHLYAPQLRQQRIFFERRHMLPPAPDDIKDEIRGLAHASILLLTRKSSVPRAQVDDWLDHLIECGFSWESAEGLLRASMNLLSAVRRDEIATGNLEQALCLEEFILDFEALLLRIPDPETSEGTLETEQTEPPEPLKSATPCTRLFKKSGDYWSLRFDGGGISVTVRDLAGMKYIAQLLRSPGRTISCSALQGALTPGSKLSKEDEERLSTVTSRDEILDETARREYSEGLAEIEEELEEATKNNDLGRIEALRRNKEMIENQLRAATNIRGQGREFDTPEERARKAVSGGIGRAIRAIAEHHRTLAEHLRRNIELGGFCHYNGDGIDWDV